MNKPFWAVIAAAALVVIGTRFHVGNGSANRGMDGYSQPAIAVDVKVPKLGQVAALGEMNRIITYVRTLQKENDIF